MKTMSGGGWVGNEKKKKAAHKAAGNLLISANYLSRNR